MQNKISRRQFLQVTGASAAALLLAGLAVIALWPRWRERLRHAS